MAKKRVEELIYPEVPLIIAREKFCELLRAQIKKGLKLLDFDVPPKYQANPNYGGFLTARRGNEGIQYDETAKKAFIAEFDRWNDRNKTIYRTSFTVAKNSYFHDYEAHLWDKFFSKDIIKDYKDEIARLINQMQGDIERADLIKCEVEDTIDIEQIENKLQRVEQTSPKTPMVFISHSSKDLEFVEALVTLLESIGFDSKTLFCSSIPDYWIGLSKDIFSSLRKLFTDHELYVLFVQSPRYYESAVSLNEMGAAWVLKNDSCSILTKDMTREQMQGVVDGSSIFIKVDTEEAAPRMNDLKRILMQKFSFPDISDTKWERKRNTFLHIVNAIVYEKNDPQTVKLSDEEYRQLQIEKLRQEAIEHKQAKIKGNIVESRTRGCRKLKIFNAGQATARNVNVEWLNKDDAVLVQWDFGLIGDITSQNTRSYNIALAVGHNETMHLRYTWADDYQEHNEFEEYLQL